MTALVEKMASRGSVTRQQLREAAANPKAARPKHYVFAYRLTTKASKSPVEFHEEPRDDVIDALEAIP